MAKRVGGWVSTLVKRYKKVKYEVFQRKRISVPVLWAAAGHFDRLSAGACEKECRGAGIGHP